MNKTKLGRIHWQVLARVAGAVNYGVPPRPSLRRLIPQGGDGTG